MCEAGDEERPFEVPSQEKTPFDHMATMESGQVVSEALQTLDPLHREVLVLRFREEMFAGGDCADDARSAFDGQIPSLSRTCRAESLTSGRQPAPSLPPLNGWKRYEQRCVPSAPERDRPSDSRSRAPYDGRSVMEARMN